MFAWGETVSVSSSRHALSLPFPTENTVFKTLRRSITPTKHPLRSAASLLRLLCTSPLTWFQGAEWVLA